MKELFIPYELALLAKLKGFDKKCFGFFKHENNQLRVESTNDSIARAYVIAPIYQQITDWFRDIHGIHVNADLLPNVKKYRATFVPLSFTPKSFTSHKEYYKEREKFSTINKFDDYYEALNEAIKEAFKLI